MRLLILTLAIFGVIMQSSGQKSDTAKRHFYFSWGYTRGFYSKSDIHFKNLSNDYNPVTNRYDNYDFVLHQATAHDRSDFDEIYDVANITIPQFVFRVGYSLNKKWGLEINYDHTKYVVDDYQTVRVTGRFNDVWVNADSVLNPQTFIHFEHTDGANFWMMNLVRKWQLVNTGKVFRATWLLKPGAGIVLPRTDVTLFGQRLNNDWKVAGWIVGVESGLRTEFYEHLFLEFVGKAAYADYVNAFVMGKHHGKATHHFYSTQATLTLGYKLYKGKHTTQ